MSTTPKASTYMPFSVSSLPTRSFHVAVNKGLTTNSQRYASNYSLPSYFLPLYFTNSGLKTHLYLLNTGLAWYPLLRIVLIASVSRIVLVTLMAKLVTRKTGNWSFALAVGILMNTRGIVQLAVLNIGVELGVLSPTIFAIFIADATIMMFATSSLVHLIYARRKKCQTKSSNQPRKPFRKLRLQSPSQFQTRQLSSRELQITKVDEIMV